MKKKSVPYHTKSAFLIVASNTSSYCWFSDASLVPLFFRKSFFCQGLKGANYSGIDFKIFKKCVCERERGVGREREIRMCSCVQMCSQSRFFTVSRQNLSLNQKLGRAKLAGQWALGITCLYSSGARVTGLHSHTWILT